MLYHATGKAIRAAMETSHRKSFDSSATMVVVLAPSTFYANLLYTLADGKCREAKQAEAGYEDGDAGKTGENTTLALFALIKLIEIVVQEVVFKRNFGKKFFQVASRCSKAAVVPFP